MFILNSIMKKLIIILGLLITCNTFAASSAAMYDHATLAPMLSKVMPAVVNISTNYAAL